MEVRQGSVLQQSSGGQVNSVELTGPIMPHSVAGLARLFAHTSHGNFTATFGGVHEPTTSFNIATADNVENLSADTVNYHQFIPHDVCHAGVTDLGKRALRELVCVDGLYSWSC